MHKKILSFAILSALLSSSAVYAASPFGAKHSNKTPIEVTSDSLEVLQDKNQATFTGHVVAIQGDVRLTADKMTVEYASSEEKSSKKKPAKPKTPDEVAKAPKEKKSTTDNAQGAIKKINAEGNVFLSTPEETASGANGVYDVEHQEIHMNNNVVLTRGKNTLKGDQLTYNFGTGRSLISSAGAAKGKERVRALFVPDNAKGK